MAGTLVDACLGAFAGSLIGDLWAGQPIGRSAEAGSGAAIGRLWGTLAKVGLGGVMVLLLAMDAFA